MATGIITLFLQKFGKNFSCFDSVIGKGKNLPNKANTTRFFAAESNRKTKNEEVVKINSGKEPIVCTVPKKTK